MLKLTDNPPVLYPRAGSLAEWPGRWWVAHTKSRFEKAFAHELLARDIRFFLPMLPRVTISSGKKRRMLMPLFPSYVFFQGDHEQRYAALATDRLCQVIEVVDQASLVKDLTHLSRALAAHAPLDLHPHAAVGRRCRIIAGPFEGMEGVVIRRDRLARVVLEVRVLGQGAAMDIEADLLEPAEAPQMAEGAVRVSDGRAFSSYT
jgi:transcription antitermination factor NusG